MNKFRVGDIVGCKPSSNYNYNITTQANNYIGRVIEADVTSDIITLRTVSSDRTGLTRKEFAVDSNHFYLLGNEYTLSKMRKKERK